jgi:predicted O-linked N-acetylglucosamine transferase (SPINDLY family)
MRAKKNISSEAKPANADVHAMTLAQVLGQAQACQAAGQLENAASLYEEWLQKKGQALAHVAWFNLGVIRGEQGLRDAAIQAYQNAIAAEPQFLEARLNLGSQFEASGQNEQALNAWREVTQLAQPEVEAQRPLLVMAYNNLGRFQEKLRQYEQAELALKHSLALKPQQPDALQHWLHLRQRQCKWPVLQTLPGLSQHDMLMSFSPLGMLAHTDEPALQLLASRNFVGRKLTPTPAPLALAPVRRPGRIRLGYLSGDLCMHAVGLLLAEVMASHDRERFETFAFDYSPEDGSAYRARLLAAFEHVEKVHALSDEAVAQKIAASGIDILIDLQGLSSGLRHGILAMRPAPVQVTYLGFIGPTAMPWIDHVLTDAFALPTELQPYFSETPLYLKSSFLPADRQRVVAAPTTRAAQGLPETGFIFASFNNAYKITEEVFSSWMRILSQCPGSCLWLVDDNPWATANMKAAAMQKGVSPDRLVFSGRVSKEQYLANLQLADLFLDGFPYNAGSTARDALSVGLPILTLSGKTFVSRMAGSLLKSLALDSLITHDLASYENRAVELAQDAHAYRQLREKLQHFIDSGEIFDAPKFTHDMENLLVHAWENRTGQAAERQLVPSVAMTPRAMSLPVAKPVPAPVNPAHVHLMHIAYSEETFQQASAGMQVLDNRDNARPDWQEYWPIRNYLLSQPLAEDAYYGFFSPRLLEKTGLNGHAIRQFISNLTNDHDLVTFSPQPDFGACFLNVFEQNDFLDPGFREVSQEFVNLMGWDMDLHHLIMDSRQIVFSNFFVAKPAFWRAWLAWTEKLFDFCENGPDSTLKQRLLAPTHYKNGVPRKVFLLERIVSLILCSQGQWKLKSYDTFQCAWSGLTLSKYPHEVVLSDALKLAAREQGFPEYLQAYAKVRDTFRNG